MKKAFIFLAGLAAGGAAGYVVAKKKLGAEYDQGIKEIEEYYEDLLEKANDGDSAKEYEEEDEEIAAEFDEDTFLDESDEVIPSESSVEDDEEVDELTEAEDIIQQHDYTSYSKNPTQAAGKKKKTEKKESQPVKKEETQKTIEVIDPEEYSSDVDYEKVTLTFLEGDDTFLDESDEVFDDGMTVVGKENLSRFGEFEDDTLYVRNHALETDFEVIYDERSYADYMADVYAD